MDRRQTNTGATIAEEEDSSPIAWINILLAAWLIISPYVLGFTHFPRAMWNNIAAGCAVGIIAIIRTSMRNQRGWSWINIILGIWLIISPFVLVFISGSAALWNNVVIGIIVTSVAWINSATPVTAMT